MPDICSPLFRHLPVEMIASENTQSDNYARSWSVLKLAASLFIKVLVALFFTHPVRTKENLINKAIHCHQCQPAMLN